MVWATALIFAQAQGYVLALNVSGGTVAIEYPSEARCLAALARAKRQAAAEAQGVERAPGGGVIIQAPGLRVNGVCVPR